MLPEIKPLPLVRVREPFEHPDWIFEPKIDGFRAVAYIEGGRCRLVSRRKNTYRSFNVLGAAVAHSLAGHTAVLDGEIVYLGADGRPQFYDLMRRRSPQYFYAFDLLWLDDEDLRELPLLERKRRLREIVPRRDSFLRYVDAFDQGLELFRLTCEKDMEGIVGKWRGGAYVENPPSWVKIKSPAYSQAEGRHELFSRAASLRKH